MKTLIFNGSPRRKGDTSQLLDVLTSQLDGEYKIVRAYDGKISPCTDCRSCWKRPGCVIRDEMQEVYEWINTCDNIVIASPVYFSELTGPLLSVMSRLQLYYTSSVILKEPRLPRTKKGFALLIGGGDGSMERAESTSRMLLRIMGVRDLLPPVEFHDTNNRPAAEDAATLEKVREAALFLKGAAL